jgi:hypothetical protein
VDLTTARLIAITNQPLRRRETMRKHLLVTLAAVMALGYTASLASAACPFDAPTTAKKFQVSLVQAMVSCGNAGGLATNTKTDGGVDACQPVTTINDWVGGPANGWRFDQVNKSEATIQMKPAIKPACVSKGSGVPAIPKGCDTDLLNAPVGSKADLVVSLKMKGIIADDSPTGANGQGTLQSVSRATLNDPIGGAMTVIDFPAGFSFTLTAGKASLKVSVAGMLNGIGLPGLGHCSALEVVNMAVLDENGNTFGNLGSILP